MAGYTERKGEVQTRLRRIEGHRGGGRAAVHVKEIKAAKRRHQFIHQRRIGCRLRTLVIIDAHGVRNRLDHFAQQ